MIKIGKNTKIEENVFIDEKTIIGNNCVISNGTIIKDSVIGDNVFIGNNNLIRGCEIGNEAMIGAFNEMARVKTGKVKISHQNIVLDSTLEDGVHISAGVITLNKEVDLSVTNKILFKKNCKIGAKSILIAPVTIGENSIVGANTFLKQSIPADSKVIYYKNKIRFL